MADVSPDESVDDSVSGSTTGPSGRSQRRRDDGDGSDQASLGDFG
jgi:hypothetical protein